MACQEEVNQHESKEKVQILRCEMMGRWEDGFMVCHLKKLIVGSVYF